MTSSDSQPIVVSQTLAANEAVETVLSRFNSGELFIPTYQRDADQWDPPTKSLFIESILNRLTVPAFYLAGKENDPDIQEVVDGQQRLTTLNDFYNNRFPLAKIDECPYYGASSHYANKKFSELDDVWKRAFRRYNLTLVSLPQPMELTLRLEVFRRINQGGTPLSAHDIRLAYYSESESVRFVQAVGLFSKDSAGFKRLVGDNEAAWPWNAVPSYADEWTQWWADNPKSSQGQTPSEMFLWFLVGTYRTQLDAVLSDKTSLASLLRLTFRENTEEALNIFCAHLLLEDRKPNEERLFPTITELRERDFPTFATWWYRIRMNCGPMANVQKHRIIALLIPGLASVFANSEPTTDQWQIITAFLKSTRNTARAILGLEFPEPKGKWRSQRRQFDAFFDVAKEIATR